MNIVQAIKTRRSIRKFQQKPIAKEVLVDLVDCARLAPYPANVQPLKFAIVNTFEITNKIFDCTKWAGYLEKGTPLAEERPTAYIVILGDKNIKSGGDFKCETGIAGSHIVLGATEYGIASCWLGALKRDKIAEILELPEALEVQDIIALGYPGQESKPVEMTDNVKYYLDQDGVLNVPKRSLENVIYKFNEEWGNAF